MKEFFKENKEVILPALLFLIVLVVFGRIVFNGFVYDDILFTFNWVVKTVVNPLYYFIQPNTLEVYITGAQDVYRPLGTWSFAIEYRFFGEFDPFYFHLINLFLHASNAVLLFFLLKKILSMARRSSLSAGSENDLLAFFGSLIFAVHAGTPETVAWAIQQYSLWSWFFSLLALYILFAEEKSENIFLNKKWKKIALLMILSFFAVFFKEHAVILPLLYVLCILIMKMGFKKRLGEIAAVTLPIILFLVLRGAVLHSFSQIELWERTFSRYQIFLTMLKGLAYYFRLLVWPWPLSINYDSFPYGESIKNFPVIASAIFLLLVISAAVYLWRKQPLFSLGIFWIFIVMMPISNFIFPTKQIISERYLYFMLPGFALAVFPAAIYIKEKVINHKKFLALLAIFAVVAIFLILGRLTFIRLGDWENDLTLWKHEIEIKPNAWKTQINYGTGLEKENRTQEAIEHYRKAFIFIPGSGLTVPVANKLGAAYIRIGEYKKAELLLTSALRHFPDNQFLIYRLGQAYLEGKEYGKAVETFKNPIWNNTNNSLIYFFAALSKKLNGETDEEIRAEIDNIASPAMRQVAFSLIEGRQKMLEGKYGETISIFENIFRQQPALPISEPYVWLGQCFEKAGEKEKALEAYRLILAITPFSIDAAQGILRNGGSKSEVFIAFF